MVQNRRKIRLSVEGKIEAMKQGRDRNRENADNKNVNIKNPIRSFQDQKKGKECPPL